MIALVGAVDGIMQGQANVDAAYFRTIAGDGFDAEQCGRIDAGMLKAYGWQYIVSGAMEPRFQKTLFGTLDSAQGAAYQGRVGTARIRSAAAAGDGVADGGTNRRRGHS